MWLFLFVLWLLRGLQCKLNMSSTFSDMIYLCRNSVYPATPKIFISVMRSHNAPEPILMTAPRALQWIIKYPRTVIKGDNAWLSFCVWCEYQAPPCHTKSTLRACRQRSGRCWWHVNWEKLCTYLTIIFLDAGLSHVIIWLHKMLFGEDE